MKYKAILFDMDGTLVPMDIHAFTSGYFKILFAKLAKYGLDPQTFQKAMWAGVSAMTRNDGSRVNAEAFWETYEQVTGMSREVVEEDCLEFYGNEFQQAKKFTGENPLAVKAVALAHEKAEQVVLATNPLFPMAGQITRMSWVGLQPEDFVLVTSFEKDRYCKPNPEYYRSVCERIGVRPEECLMIGNDEDEDAFAASSVGMDCFIVTDSLIESEEHPWKGARGSFADLVIMLEAL